MFLFLMLRLMHIIIISCIFITLAQKGLLLQLVLFTTFLLIMCLYAIYLVHLNQKVRQTFQRICAHFRESQQWQPRKESNNKNWRPILQNYWLYLHEMDIYGEYFTLRMFYLIPQLDMSVLFTTALVIFNYVVFLYQTN